MPLSEQTLLLVAQAECLNRIASLPVFADDSDGKWVTIGAVDHHGGTPVEIKDGKIAKGPSHLVGHDPKAIPKKNSGKGVDNPQPRPHNAGMENTNTPASETKAPSTPSESVSRISSMQEKLTQAKEKLDSAKNYLDSAGEAAAKSELDSIRDSAIAAWQATGEWPADNPKSRADAAITAAANGATPSQLKKIIEANRTSMQDRGIVVPVGRFENLSRGKGWCRQGKGNSAVWADRDDKGGFVLSSPGNWTVGSNDGFSRKDTVEWSVEKIAGIWIAN